MEEIKERIRSRLKDAILLMCIEDLNFDVELSIDGLVGITIDKQKMMMVTIKESIQKGNNAAGDCHEPTISNGIHIESGFSLTSRNGSPLQSEFNTAQSISENNPNSILFKKEKQSSVRKHKMGPACSKRKGGNPGFLAGSASLSTLANILRTAKKRTLPAQDENTDLEDSQRQKMPRLTAIDVDNSTDNSPTGESECIMIHPDVIIKKEHQEDWQSYVNSSVFPDQIGTATIQAHEQTFFEDTFEDDSHTDEKKITLPSNNTQAIENSSQFKEALKQLEPNKKEFDKWCESQFSRFSSVLTREKRDFYIHFLKNGCADGLTIPEGVKLPKLHSMLKEKQYQIIEGQESGESDLVMLTRGNDGHTNMKRVPCKEEFFDIISKTHLLMEHAGNKRTFKKICETYCLVPKRAVLKFMQLCPRCKDRSFYKAATPLKSETKEDGEDEDDLEENEAN